MNSRCSLLVTLVVLAILAACCVDLAAAQTKRRGGSAKMQQEVQSDLPPAYQDDNSGGGTYDASGEVPVIDNSGAEEQEKQIASLSKADQIAFYESEVEWIREHEVQPALRAVNQATSGLERAKSAGGWFPNAQQKETIRIMEDEYRRASMQLQRAKSREVQLSNRMKPLYGIVSYQWMQEQRATIRESLKTVNEMAYNQAWWSSLFNSRAESLTDLIIGFFVQWLVTYIIIYPFAAAYYVLWSAPWSIFEYSSSISDIFVGLIAWLAAALAITLPFVALVGGIIFFVRKYQPELEARAQARRHHY